MKIKRIFVAVLVILLAGTFGYAYGKDTAQGKSAAKAEAKAMVNKAEAFVKANGKEKAIAEFNKPDGQFVKGSFYVFAYDLKGTTIAQPVNPSLVGKNMINEPDSQGKLFRKEIVEKAKSQGEGWIDYKRLNPTTKKETTKTTYFKKVGDIIIGCGAY
jgi:cytochrome c